MAKKGISVWIFSSLTFLSLLHLIEAITVLFFNNQVRLLKLYPIIGAELVQTITPTIYFWAVTVATFILWGVTCAIAFENPVDKFLNSILSDAKQQGNVETQMLEAKSEILDAMYETVESSSETLAHVKDMVYNTRTEVKEIQPIRETVEKMKTELTSLKREIKRIEEKMKFPLLCSACGKALSPEFKMCPYCGERIRTPQAPIISLKDYK